MRSAEDLIGDRIVFTNLDDPMKKIAVTVRSLHRYASFEDLFADIPLEKCGNNSTDTPDMATVGMSKYYTADQIRKYMVPWYRDCNYGYADSIETTGRTKRG